MTSLEDWISIYFRKYFPDTSRPDREEEWLPALSDNPENALAKCCCHCFGVGRQLQRMEQQDFKGSVEELCNLPKPHSQTGETVFRKNPWHKCVVGSECLL